MNTEHFWKMREQIFDIMSKTWLSSKIKPG